MNQAFPFVRLLGNLAGQQHFDSALQEVSCGPVAWADRLRLLSASSPIEPGWKYASIVENHQVVGSKKGGKFAEPSILDASRSAIQVQ
jgi:hypothetical protein